MKFTAKFVLFSALSLCAQSAMASDLKECQKQIYEMFRPLRTTETWEVVPTYEGSRTIVGYFHMSPTNNCGVEVVEDKGWVRVNQFEAPKKANPEQIKIDAFFSSGAKQLGVEKFETIKLNENDPTYADGRIKYRIGCEIKGDKITYTTALPVYADGVKSAFGITTLEIKKSNGQISVDLTASAYPYFNGLIKSLTSCKLKY